MKISASAGRESVASVYIAEFADGRLVEMVESVQPPLPREKKWVLIVSTMFGCPVACPMCDAGGHYRGTLTKGEILDQLDFLVTSRYPDCRVPAEKFKIQFARMGEPSFNPAVLKVLEALTDRYDAPGLIPCLSTVAPSKADAFFGELLRVKKSLYNRGDFQMQFSIHTTDPELRDKLIPVAKWNFAQIAHYCADFRQPSDRKITLNFALVRDVPVDPELLRRYFNPADFLIKLTPVNPTYAAVRSELQSHIDTSWAEDHCRIVGGLRDAGYEVLVSIGELEENLIGSNCGQFLMQHVQTQQPLPGGYSYEIIDRS